MEVWGGPARGARDANDGGFTWLRRVLRNGEHCGVAEDRANNRVV